jgi:hypothetical protein
MPQTPRIEQPNPQVPSTAVGEPKLPGTPVAQTSPTAQTPRIEEPNPEPHEVSEPNGGFVDKNLLAPLIIAMSVALPLLSVLFLIRMLRSKA